MIFLILLISALIILIGILITIILKSDFLEDPEYRQTITKMYLKEMGSLDKTDWNKLPDKIKKKLSMSRLSLLVSVFVISLSVMCLIGVYAYLAIYRPADTNCINLREISLILVFPALGILPYLFNQARKIRL
jgi:hypothetical protein